VCPNHRGQLVAHAAPQLARDDTGMPLTDAEAKQRISRWPAHTRIWSRDDEQIGWLRAQPPLGGITSPRLQQPGAGAFRTQPDGLWITLGIEAHDQATAATFVDCVAIESCRNAQNFNDKRSRYAARTTSLMLAIPQTWLEATVRVQAGATRTRAAVLRGNLPAEDVSLPVRHLRVLYALPDDDGAPGLFARVSAAMVLEAHEYICPQRVLGSYTGQPMQTFLKRMAPGLTRFP